MDWIAEMLQGRETAAWLLAASVIMFFGSIGLAWIFIIRMPADYLINKDAHVPGLKARHPVIAVILRVLRNLLGLLFVVSGFIMLFIPGQGVLFILLGSTLMDYPGKRRLIRKLIGWRNTLKVINQIRAKAGQPPLQHDEHAHDQ